MTTLDYQQFIAAKTQAGGDHGFSPDDLPDWLFPFQTELDHEALTLLEGVSV